MSTSPAASPGLHRAPAGLSQKDKDRARALVLIFASAALAAGGLAAVASYAVLAYAVGLLLIVLAAWTLPVTWLGPVLAALVPFQFYLPVPATSFTMRAALIFAFAVAIRIAVHRRALSFVFRPQLALSGAEGSLVKGFAWLLPAGLFMLAAFVAALGAQDRYSAFKGIYDWLVVLLTAFIVAALIPSTGTVRHILSILIAGGVAQALLGLLQYVLGLSTILELLRLPISGLLYQPNLLKDKLGDLSFNWVTFDRALPFGTFINGIDYAVFLAAILSLIIALLIAREQPPAGPVQVGIHLSSRRVPHPERGVAESKGRDDLVKAQPSRAIPGMAEIEREGGAFTTSHRPLLATLGPHARAGVTNCGSERPLASAVIGRPSALALVISALVIAVALLLTFKGSGMLALMGGIATTALISLSRPSKRTVAVGLVMVVGTLVVALPFADLIGQRALFLLQREQGSAGSVGRLQTWMSLVQFVAQRPLFGYGLNNAIALIAPQWTLREGALGFVFSTPESAYVSALVETGLVGFVSLTGWLLAAVVNGYRRVRAARQKALGIGILAALVALVFGNLTVCGLTTDQNGMLLGMLIGMIYGSQRDDRDQV